MTTARSTGVILARTAVAKTKALLDQEGATDLALRISVVPDGCTGLHYQPYFDDRSLNGDIAEIFGDIKLVVGRQSVPCLSGATIDFTNTIGQQGFTIDNPNATGSCACGNSFN